MSPTMLEYFHVKERKLKDIGIEIEMEGGGLKYPIRKYWDVANDGSLRGNSIEYVLRNPVVRTKVWDRLKFLRHELKIAGSKLEPSERCGVHIHVNCQTLNTKQVINFAVLYLIIEDILVKWCGEQREGNMFCLRASDADRIIHGLSRCRADDNMDYMQHNDFRYAAMNMAALCKFGSVEFRALETPKEFKKIATWAEMLMKIKDASQAYEEPYHIIENMSQLGGDRFLRSVLGDLARKVICPDMERLMQDGVQRVQEIAYTEVAKKPHMKSVKKRIYGDHGVEAAPRRPGGRQAVGIGGGRVIPQWIEQGEEMEREGG